jgi:hypothetical protein
MNSTTKNHKKMNTSLASEFRRNLFLGLALFMSLMNPLCSLSAQQKIKEPTLVDRFYFKQGPNIAKPADFTQPNRVLTGDFNQDNITDVLAYSSFQKKLGWYKQQTALGSFDTLRVISNDVANLREIIVSDYDGDGDDDILALQTNTGKVLYFNNISLGRFSAAQTLFEKNDLTSFHLVDIDGNGFDDIVVASQSDRSVYLLKRSAVAGLQESVIATNITGVTSIKTADYSKNGKLDVVISSAATNQILLIPQNSNGSFETPMVVNSTASLPTFVVANDIDGDSNIDIAVFGIQSQSIYWQKNRGNLTFEPPRILATNLVGLSDFRSSDLDGDGDADLVYSLASAQAIFWLENLENNTFGLPQLIANNGLGVQQFSIADINNDGISDIVSASKDDDRISWYKNFGGRRFDTPKTISRRADIYNPSDVAVADINNDSFNDIVVASSDNGNLIWYANSSTNTFSDLTVITDSVANFTSFFPTDLNVDARRDFLFAIPSKNTVEWYSASAAGVFSAKNILSSTNGISAVISATIDSDDAPDLISASPQSGVVSIHYNQGNETFPTASPLAGFFPGTNRLAAAKINSDNRVDIISASSSSSIIHVHTQAPDSSFSTQPFNVSQIQGVSSLILNDLNSDGRTDLVVASAIDNKLLLLRNNGVGGFDPAIEIDGNALGVRVLASQDLDGDGDLDILSAHYDANSVVWYENSVGVFGDPQVISDENMGAQGLALGDLNSDGIADLAVASGIDNKVIWYKNGLAQKNGTNTAPQKLAEFTDVQVTSRPTAVSTLPMTSYFSDPDGNPLKYAFTLSIDTSAVTAVFDQNNRLLVNIGANYLGTFTVNVTATDGNLSAKGSFKVQSIKVNNAPVFTGNFQNLTFTRGWQGATQPVALNQVFSDPDGDSLTYSLEFNANHVLAVVQNNSIVLQEVPTFLGVTGINVTARDPGNFAITRSFTITISPPNRTPVVTDTLDEVVILTSAASATVVTLSQLFADPDGNALTYSIDYQGSLFTPEIIQNASVQLTPNTQATGGKDSFLITATDGEFTVSSTIDVWLRYPAPTILYPTSSANVNRAVEVTWQNIPSATRQEFTVFQVIAADTTDIFQDMVVDPAQTSYQIPNLEYGQNYTISIKAADATGNKGVTASRNFNVVGAPTTAYTKEILTPSVALNDSSFRLISLPGSYTPLPVEQFFAPVGKRGTDWAVYDYQGQDSTGNYSSDQLNFTAGKAFWHLNKDTLDVDYQAGPPNLNDKDDFTVVLVPGWNLIGSPFLTENVLWVRVQQYNQTTQPIWRFNQEWSQTTSMLPFEGYYFFSEQADTLKIPLGDRPAPVVSSAPATILSAKMQNEANLAVRLSLAGMPDLELNQPLATDGLFPMPAPNFAKRAIWLIKRNEFNRTPRHLWKTDITRLDNGLLEAEIGYKMAKSEAMQLDLTRLKNQYPSVTELLVLNSLTLQVSRLSIQEKLEIGLPKGQATLKIWFGSTLALDSLEDELLPKQTQISKAYPNPFNPSTTIGYNLAEGGLATLEVYNVLGQKVTTLVNATMQKGAYQIEWNASSFATGVYLFRLQLNGRQAGIKKVTLIK